ncbi:hypothetical protein BOTBODRAFT_37323 [Botryobasidium botryosum FD-172 SS1]|uniref:Uncharacterized protein n=1 Tax=Botryobasidium botryosum (strain FD-172 SS1) TaxID=930990 RepID=A0A067MB25_BOTB1|nr:hypothetical protein BOTBODRAFT_37323 [Botryobasidium botryosum FD-172 SS1]
MTSTLSITITVILAITLAFAVVSAVRGTLRSFACVRFASTRRIFSHYSHLRPASHEARVPISRFACQERRDVQYAHIFFFNTS